MDENNHVDLDEVGIVPTGIKNEHKEEYAQMPSVGTALADSFDRYTKLIYLFDVSGSMMYAIDPVLAGERFLWSDEELKAVREHMQKDLADDEPWQERYDFPDTDVAAMKSYAVEYGVLRDMNLSLPANPAAPKQARSKLEAVKDAAKGFVRERFAKYPDAQVVVMKFSDEAKEVTRGAGLESVLFAIDKLETEGSTEITDAVIKAVDLCQRRPSKVGMHHIVLVSDGFDSAAVQVRGQLPRMKDLNIVFDFIFMAGKSQYDLKEDSEVVKVLKSVCDATGGEFTRIDTEKDFKQKFLQASARKCLPPART